MMMYYDARPGAWCGLFETDMLDPLKPYYAFYLFRELPRLGNYIEAPFRQGNIYSCAATNGEDAAIILTNYSDNDEAPSEDATVLVKSLSGRARAEIYLLDENHDAELIEEKAFDNENATVDLKLPLFTTYLIKIIKE
jgi:hypothetical protein